MGEAFITYASLINVLIIRYINDIFLKSHKPTVGVEFCSKEIKAAKAANRTFNLQFWDIGGQERYIYMTHVYYKSSDFCLIMFDLNNRESFKACARWKRDLDEKYRLDDGSKCPCLLIGNKAYYLNFYSMVLINIIVNNIIYKLSNAFGL